MASGCRSSIGYDNSTYHNQSEGPDTGGIRTRKAHRAALAPGRPAGSGPPESLSGGGHSPAPGHGTTAYRATETARTSASGWPSPRPASSARKRSLRRSSPPAPSVHWLLAPSDGWATPSLPFPELGETPILDLIVLATSTATGVTMPIRSAPSACGRPGGGPIAMSMFQVW